ncbi:hypothetical protein DM02DRAFT_673638 [Periconia macrospinosa]|uniref:N-acetyltransferase domain-containing protein n=1 Tax=Periconia macrospinosa TaxID=97972 RepID=A0A2V1DJ51_9PLEO|nr:hypothetical protein DM02DRAFT_673638 [Periconia macrospinosa]
MGSIVPHANPAPKYILQKVEMEQEMGHVMDVIWEANYSPYDPIIQIVFPVLGYTSADREKCLVESKKRLWEQHKADPASNWFYVIDTESLKHVGCCQWQIFTSKPDADPQPLTTPWWPEGEHREFCELMLNKIYRRRLEWMRRPYLALNWMAVVPEYRRKGIGTMLMKQGIEAADKLNLECWMEASAMGIPLYQHFNFRALSRIDLDNIKENTSDVWKRCQHELTPPTITAMWRPRGGSWEDIKLPWEIDED